MAETSQFGLEARNVPGNQTFSNKIAELTIEWRNSTFPAWSVLFVNSSNEGWIWSGGDLGRRIRHFNQRAKRSPFSVSNCARVVGVTS